MLLCHALALPKHFAGPFRSEKPLGLDDLRPTRVDPSQYRHVVNQNLAHFGLLYKELFELLPGALCRESYDLILEEVLNCRIDVKDGELNGDSCGNLAAVQSFTYTLHLILSFRM